MERIIFVMDENGKAQRPARAPEWATHVIKRKADQVLFFARNYTGENEFYTGPGPVMEFHPDGYDVYDVIIKTPRPAPPAKAVAEPESEEVPAPKTGEKWYVQLPGRVDLVVGYLERVTPRVAVISYTDSYRYEKAYQIWDLTFVEKIA